MNANAAPAPQPSAIEALPRTIASSVLSYVTSDDWLNFRTASKNCHEIVNGTSDVWATASSDAPANGGNESDSLWKLALFRDYGFGKPNATAMIPLMEEGGGEDVYRRCIRSPSDSLSGAFLYTKDVFTAPSCYVAWKHWRRIDQRFHRNSLRGKNIPSTINGPYFLRACAMWRKIEQWCKDEGRSGPVGNQILSSLLPGTALDVNVDGRISNAKTSALKAVYAFYAGQRDPMEEGPDPEHPMSFNPFIGLFGGFSAYNTISCTRFVEPEICQRSGRLVIAESGIGKKIVLDLSDGCVSQFCTIGGRNMFMAAAGPTEDAPRRPDQLLLWFEKHADRLQRNFLAVGDILKHKPECPPGYSLLRYPTVADTANCSRAVTRGVEVVASSVFAPEMQLFVYSIRIRLLAPEDGEGYETPEQRGFETCQLVSRYWRISKAFHQFEDNDQLLDDVPAPQIEEVRGEGVIGFYPLLQEGGYVSYHGNDSRSTQSIGTGEGCFSYQSCTHANLPGSMEGSLQLVPGSLDKPEGEMFDVSVAPFPMEFDNWLY